jgi:hypothetical protein
MKMPEGHWLNSEGPNAKRSDDFPVPVLRDVEYVVLWPHEKTLIGPPPFEPRPQPSVITLREMRELVTFAVKLALRRCTHNGHDEDFDADALLIELGNVLFGPAGPRLETVKE